jgi:large subunit ribosomal protein L32
MPHPKQKRTKASKRRRASHFGLKDTNLTKCSKCGKPKLPHHACEFCGTYKGKEVIRQKSKKKTVKQKAQERRQQEREKQENKEEKKATKKS